MGKTSPLVSLIPLLSLPTGMPASEKLGYTFDRF